jgi:hypothetical protein
MSVALNVHRVSRIEVSAYSAPLVTLAGTPRMHCQTLVLFDAENACIGRIVLFLDNPDHALPVGDRSHLDGTAPAPAELAVLAALSPF